MSNVPEYKVSEISYLIKRKLENDFGYIQVKGEISDLKLWNGHYLFNLKDEESVLASRIWKNKVPMLNFKPEEGLIISAIGKISTHLKRSGYNLLIDNISSAGEGTLLKLIELRKKKLQDKGFFNKSKALPFLPKKVAVITSITGAVIEDIKNKILTKFPSYIMIWPVNVQGILAENNIVNALKGINQLSKKNAPDVIILARGGGSLEDLMPFNSEKIAIEIFKSTIPIVSAVGHQTDYTIADLAADHRAATPTAAADMVVPDKKVLDKRVADLSRNSELFINRFFSNSYMRINLANQRLINPKRVIENNKEKLENLSLQAYNRIKFKLNENEKIVNALKLKSPYILLQRLTSSLQKTKFTLNNKIREIYKKKIINLKNKIEVLSSSSYQRWLEKGFVIVKNKNNKIVKASSKLSVNQDIKINFFDGGVSAKIRKINNKT